MGQKTAFAQLRNILVNLYEDVSSARRITDDAGIDASRIALSASSINTWHAILAEAEKTNKVEALLAEALAEYPNNSELKAAAQAYQLATSGGSGGTKQPPTPITGPGAAPVPLQRPPLAEHFVNQQAELRQLLAELQPGRVVTLCGPGGIGKTALAAEAIWQLAPGSEAPARFPDGILFHDFYNIPQAELALEHIVRSFGDVPQPTPTAAAKRVLAGKHALLVLDGAEQADDLDKVLAVRDQCGVLVTSRRRSDSLTIRLDLASLPADAAVALLQAHAGERILDNDAAQRVCELLGGLPLAVELAGDLLAQQSLDVREFLKQLEDQQLSALAHGQRQRVSVLLVLQQSIDQTSQPAQSALGIAGLLEYAPFDAEIIAAALQSPASTHRALGELINYGLLRRSDEGRYEVSHTLIHTFAREKFAPPTDIVTRLAGYFTSYANQHQHELERLAYVLPHVLAVLNHCEKQKLWSVIQNLVMAIDPYLDLQGYWNDRLKTNKVGLAAAQALQNYLAEGAWLNNLGEIYHDLGQIEQAIDHYQQALTIGREIGDRRGEDASLGNLGLAYADLGQVEQAIDYYQQALTIAKEIGDRRGEGNHRGALGNVYATLGQMEQAIDYYQRALAIAKEIGDRRGEGNHLGALGNVYVTLGQMDLAISYYQQALTIAKEIGDHRGEGARLGNLGLTYVTLGQVEQAIGCYQQALIIAREIGDRRGEGNHLGALGNVYVTLGYVEQAIEYYQQALAIARELGDRRGEGNYLENLAAVYVKLDQLDQAIQYYHAFLKVMRDIGDRRGELHCVGDLGDVYMSNAQMQNAIEQYEVALQIADELGDQPRKVVYLRNVATAYQILEQINEALTYYQQLVDLLRLTDLKQAAETLLTMGDLALAHEQIAQARLYWTECQSIYAALNSSHVQSVAARLANLVASHPELFSLLEMTQQYITKAGFAITPASASTILVCQPIHNTWLEHTKKPVPLKVLSGVALEMNMVLKLVEESTQLLGETPHCIIIVCDHAPTDGAWLQIGAQRANGINIMPVDDSILRTGLQQNRHRAVLLSHLEERYLGPQRDLYDRQNPISDRLNFFGREPLADQLADNLQQGHAVALFGLRKMGKSSLLNYVRDRLPYPAVVIDLQVSTALKDIYDRIVAAWLARLQTLQPTLNWQPPPPSGDETPSVYFSRIVLSLLAALEGARAPAQLAVFVDEIELIYPHKETELTTYLDFARTLRGLAQEQLGKFGLIVAGVDPNMVRINRLFGQQNPFYNFFRIQYLPPLNEQHCIQMIRNIGVQMGLQYTDDALAFVAYISGGHPYWARKLCSLAFKTWKEPGPVTQAHLATVARRFVQNPDTAQLLDQRGLWGEVTDRYLWQEDDAAANEAILLALAESEQRTRTDLLAHAAKPTAYQRSLAELDDRAIIDEVATDSFWIHLHLFRNWIRTDKLGKE